MQARRRKLNDVGSQRQNTSGASQMGCYDNQVPPTTTANYYQPSQPFGGRQQPQVGSQLLTKV